MGASTYDGRFDTGMQLVAPFLWQHYVRHLDLMALTHMHPDHARGLVSTLRLFPTQHLLTNGSAVTSDYVRDLLTAGQRWGTQQHTAMDGSRHWQWERLQMTRARSHQKRLRSNAPPGGHATETDRSLVLRLQYGAVRLLLTGISSRPPSAGSWRRGLMCAPIFSKCRTVGAKPQHHWPLCSRYSRVEHLDRCR